MNRVTTRHKKVLRDNINGVTKPAIQRLCRRGGVKRLSSLIYEETRGVLKVFLENVIRDSVTFTEHCRRKTVIATDVVYALKRQERDLYGFGVPETYTTKRKNTQKSSKKDDNPKDTVTSNAEDDESDSLNDADVSSEDEDIEDFNEPLSFEPSEPTVKKQIERKKSPSYASGSIPYGKKLNDEIKEFQTFMQNEMEKMVQEEMEKMSKNK